MFCNERIKSYAGFENEVAANLPIGVLAFHPVPCKSSKQSNGPLIRHLIVADQVSSYNCFWGLDKGAHSTLLPRYFCDLRARLNTLFSGLFFLLKLLFLKICWLTCFNLRFSVGHPHWGPLGDLTSLIFELCIAVEGAPCGTSAKDIHSTLFPGYCSDFGPPD